MDTPPPLATVIMPCYNHARFVTESVMAILRQTVADFELIVIDDASKDDSVAVIRELARLDARVKLIAHPKNRGASASRNAGLSAAQGEYVAFCDADDLWMPNKLEHQIKLLTAHPEYDVVYCASEIIDEKGQRTGNLFSREFPVPSPPSGNLFEVLSERNFINMQTVLVRRRAVGERLFFDESIKWVEDWWLWIRLSHDHLFVYEPSILAQYRVHPQSTGRTQKFGILRNRWKVCRRNLKIHSDIPGRLQARLWYKMGLELSLMRRHQLACKFFCRATRLGMWKGESTKRLLTMAMRSGVEYFRGLAPNKSRG